MRGLFTTRGSAALRTCPQPASSMSSLISVWRVFPSLIPSHGFDSGSTPARESTCDQGLANQHTASLFIPPTATVIGSGLGVNPIPW